MAAEGCRRDVKRYKVDDEGVPTNSSKEQVSIITISICSCAVFYMQCDHVIFCFSVTHTGRGRRCCCSTLQAAPRLWHWRGVKLLLLVNSQGLSYHFSWITANCSHWFGHKWSWGKVTCLHTIYNLHHHVWHDWLYRMALSWLGRGGEEGERDCNNDLSACRKFPVNGHTKYLNGYRVE